ncbi:RNA-dependent RNA polymerase, partial [viral metagenome]
NSIFRTSASRHGPSPTVAEPLFKDCYFYVDVETYRKLSKVFSLYSKANDKFRIPSSSERCAGKTALRAQQRQRAQQIRSARKYLDSTPVHNGFPNDTHSEYLRLLLAPRAKDFPSDLNSRRLPKSITTHPKFDSNLILPQQLPVVYQNLESRKWVNDRRDPFLTEFALSHGLAVEEIRPKGTQLKSAGSDPFVFVGPNTRYCHSDKLAYTMRRWHNTPKLDRKCLEAAISRTVAQYSTVKFAPMTYSQVISSQQFLKNRSHDVGFSGAGFNDKFELATNPAFRAFQHRYESSSKPATFNVFWKSEPLKQSKAKFIPRLIFGGSLENEITERKQFQTFSQNLALNRWTTPAKIGIPNTEFGKLYKHNRFHLNYSAIAIDFSAQDVKMPAAVIDARIRVLSRLAINQGLTPFQVNKIVSAAKHTQKFSAVLPNGEVFLLKSGVPSGLYFGAEGNTMNHSVIGNYLDARMNFHASPTKVIDSRYGDDWLRSLAPNRQSKAYLRRFSELSSLVSNDIGMSMTVDLWGEKPLNHHESSFLRRSFTNWTIDDRQVTVPKFDTDRVLQRFVVPHSNVTTPQESFDRSLCFLMLSGANTHYYSIIRKYMDSLVNSYNVQVPDLYREMTLNSLTK